MRARTDRQSIPIGHWVWSRTYVPLTPIWANVGLMVRGWANGASRDIGVFTALSGRIGHKGQIWTLTILTAHYAN